MSARVSHGARRGPCARFGPCAHRGRRSLVLLHVPLLAALLLAAHSGCGRRADSEEKSGEKSAEPVVAVRVVAVETRDFDDAIEAPGEWRSAGDVVVAAPFAATLESLSVRVGDRVAAGQTLGWLVTRESQSALRGAQLLALSARDAAEKDEAQRALDLARRDLVRVPLASPRAGFVARRSVEPGAQVDESAEVVAIVPLDAIVFEAHVPAAAAARLATGQPATISEPGRASRDALLTRTLPVASASDQATLAWLAPTQHATEAASPPPEIGRFGTARIEVGAPRNSPAVPDSSIVLDDLTGESRVAVVGAEGRAAWQVVTLGARADGWREVTAPALAPGTQVIVEGQHGLPDSTRVTTAP